MRTGNNSIFGPFLRSEMYLAFRSEQAEKSREYELKMLNAYKGVF